MEIMKTEYERLGSVLQKCTIMELVKRVEVELSRNMTFKVLSISVLAAIHSRRFLLVCLMLHKLKENYVHDS